MSHSLAYSFETNQSLMDGVVSFYRRWFASETIHNKNALDEIGLGYLADGR